MMRPVQIPETSKDYYISLNHALNLRFPDENTGDWHFEPCFFDEEDTPLRHVQICGMGCNVNTNLTLKNLGVREMSKVLLNQGLIGDLSHEVYVANHFRAIADLSMSSLRNGKYPYGTCVSFINDMLDTEEQVKTLKNDYLLPLRSQLSQKGQEQFDKWIVTVKFQ